VTAVTRDADSIRAAFAQAFERVRMTPPPACKDLDGKPWHALLPWCRDQAERDRSSVRIVAEKLAAGLLAHRRASKQGHPLRWVLDNPGEFFALAPSNPLLGGGETDEQLLADLRGRTG
jgi:hypothetical protein